MLYVCLTVLLKQAKLPLVTKMNLSVFVCEDGYVRLEVSRQL